MAVSQYEDLLATKNAATSVTPPPLKAALAWYQQRREAVLLAFGAMPQKPTFAEYLQRAEAEQPVGARLPQTPSQIEVLYRALKSHLMSLVASVAKLSALQQSSRTESLRTNEFTHMALSLEAARAMPPSGVTVESKHVLRSNAILI